MRLLPCLAQFIAMHVDCSQLHSLWSPHLTPEEVATAHLAFHQGVLCDMQARLAVLPLHTLWQAQYSATVLEPGTQMEAPDYSGSSHAIAAMNALFDRLPDLDAKQALLEHFVLLALRRAAAQLGCRQVLVGDTTNRCAERVLSSVAQGNGYGVGLQAALMDNRFHSSGFGDASGDAGVLFVRPLADAEQKEVQLFCRWAAPSAMPATASVPYLFTPTFFTKAPPRSSVRQAVASLVAMLQASFPSSAFNVLRTVKKLARPEGLSLPGKADVRARRARERRRVAAVLQASQGTPSEAAAAPTPDVPCDAGSTTPAAAQPGLSNTAFVPCPLCGNLLNGVELARLRETPRDLRSALCYGCRTWSEAGGASLPQDTAGLPVAMLPDILHAVQAGEWLHLSAEQAAAATAAQMPMATAESAAELARAGAPAAQESEPVQARAAEPMSRAAMRAAIEAYMLLPEDAEEGVGADEAGLSGPAHASISAGATAGDQE